MSHLAQSITTSSVAVIIVNYKTGHLLEASLLRLQSARKAQPGLHVFIVDNRSPDDSVSVIKATIARHAWEPWVHLIAHDVNGGFAAGNHVGVTNAMNTPGFDPAFFFFLNPDAYIEDGAVDALLTFSAKQHHRAVLGGLLLDETGAARPSGFRFPSVISEFQRGACLGIVDRCLPGHVTAMPVSAHAHQSDWVTGAAFWVPRALWEAVGGMDQGYFLYFEEVDFMLQIRKAGFDVWTVPDARVVHIAGASTKIVKGKISAKRMPAYWYQSWHRFHFKNQGTVTACMRGMAWLVGSIVNQILAIGIKHRRDTGGHHRSDFVRFALLNRRS